MTEHRICGMGILVSKRVPLAAKPPISAMASSLMAAHILAME